MAFLDQNNQGDREIKGTVLEIQRMSTEDGPGIRTTVFFKGCTLKCAWCHNPESISPRPQIQWIESRCIGCGTCLGVCPEKALSAREQGGVVIDRGLCRGCGLCAEECPAAALELWGRPWGARELAAEVAKDRAYFEQSGGGVTASGGEATMQADFLAAFLRACRERELRTALDTCGQTSREALAQVLPWVDLVLYDLKEIDPERHRRFTGHSNRVILENLLFIAARVGRKPELWIRTPIIPGATDNRENIRGLGEFISRNLKGRAARWELCSFNNLCRDKYVRLGLDWAYRDAPLMTAGRMDELTEIAEKALGEAGIVSWSGSTRRESDDSASRDPGFRLVKGGRRDQASSSREER
ncbi:MAG: glycyl-radical enzyme activating protein [Pseudomonadota bacterium]